MVNTASPILFKMRDAAYISGGMQPFKPAVQPAVWPTPFGVTDSDIKGPGIPMPLLFRLEGAIHAFPLGRVPMPATYLRIFGVTKDSNGVLGNCTVSLFETLTGKYVEQTVSDANGNYEFRSPSLTVAYFVVAYKTGVPDVSGTTISTLTGT